MKKKIIALGIGCMMLLGMTMGVFAASATFSVNLPVKQGDTEVSTIKKEKTQDYFWVVINTIGSGTNKVCAWAEGDLGANLSSPTKQIAVGGHAINYTSIPNVGKRVTLNLDNPVYLTYTVAVTGSWTPN